MFVAVGSSVGVLEGMRVGVSVLVAVGNALAVCVDAAFAVSAMIKLIALGSSAGAGGGADVSTGAHANMKANAANQKAYFDLLLNMFRA